MRVTQSMMTRTLMNSINSTRDNLSYLQNSITTGKEVSQSSNDPIQFARASRFRNTINQNEQYLKNITDAYGWTDTVNGVLADLSNKLMDVKELATQGADDSNDQISRSMLAAQVDSILEEVIDVTNSTYLGKNVFSGTRTHLDSFTYDGATITYNGNDQDVVNQISENQSIPVSITGSQLMDSGLLSSILELRNGLVNNDQASIQNSIDNLESSESDLIAFSTSIGNVQNQLSMSEQRLNMANVNLTSYLSQTEDMDLSEAITKYTAEEMAYRAALQTTSDSINLNLLDFLR